MNSTTENPPLGPEEAPTPAEHDDQKIAAEPGGENEGGTKGGFEWEEIPISQPQQAEDQKALDLLCNTHEAWINNVLFSDTVFHQGRANFEGLSLAGLNLSRRDLRCANFRRADLSGCDLSGTNFSRAKLDEAKLDGANLTATIFKEASLKQTSMIDCDLDVAEFQGVDLSVAITDDL